MNFEIISEIIEIEVMLLVERFVNSRAYAEGMVLVAGES
jgi:hypothetical protein